MQTLKSLYRCVVAVVSGVSTGVWSSTVAKKASRSLAPGRTRYIATAVRQEVNERQRDDEGRYHCATCLGIIPNDDGHFSHCEAWSHGGDNTAANLLLCCRKCNLEVSNKHPAVYYASKGDIPKFLRVMSFHQPSAKDCEELFKKYHIKNAGRANRKEVLKAICYLEGKGIALPREFREGKNTK